MKELPAARAPSQRLPGLDALRGLAAMSVVLFHYTTGYEARFGPFASRPLFYWPNGHFGVELFFCISGFVILGTIQRTSNLKRFAIARFARIYPAYLVCATLALLALRIAHFDFPGMTAKVIAINATMLTELAGVPAIDPSYWTLTYEILFYAAAATVWSLLRSRRRFEWPCLAWLGISLIGHLFTGINRHHRLSVLLDIEYANLFVLGMMLYYISQDSRTRLTIPTGCAALLMALFPPENNGGGMPLAEYRLLIAAFCALIWLVSNGSKRFLDVRPLVFLGEISYSLYLVHQVVGFVVIRALLAAGLATNLTLLITISLVIGLASYLRAFVEKPAERWIKNLAQPRGRAAQSRQAAVV
jgi:peptidoglycan/LPS O-acetylase OafA/YrhL